VKRFLSTAVVSLALATSVFVPVSQARTCSGNGDLIGSYGFVAARDLFVGAAATPAGSAGITFVPVAATPPGTTGAIATATPLGQLVAGASGTSPFDAVGVLAFDGNGNLLASNSAGVPNTMLNGSGAYKVNTDCTVSGTIDLNNTVFTTSSSVPVPVVTFQGVILDRGNEIDITTTGASASGLVITMKKTIQASGCSLGSLNGTYGFAGTASTITTPTGGSAALTSSLVLGRFFADGNGSLQLDPTGAASPLTALELAAGAGSTYTVNQDCTGTATLVLTGGQVRSIRFVIVNESPVGGSGTAPQELLFTFTDSAISGRGSAKQQ